MKAITPCLWFENQAEQAAKFYTSIFKNSRISEISYYGSEGPMPAGTALVVSFSLNEQPFMALNGGPEYKFTPAISFYVGCDNQREVDELWEKLSAGGEKGQCGWLTDQFGVSWQIVPTVLSALLMDPDAEKSARVMRAMLQMTKLDIAQLQSAYKGS